MQTDPKSLARAQFTRPDIFADALDIVGRYATDPPLIVAGLLRALAPSTEPSHILEVGFGTGWLLEFVAERFPEAALVGIDLSQSFIDAARRKIPAATLIRGDMEALPFRDGVFDRAASCCALYFARDIERAVRELARVTRPGGRMVINTVGSDNLKEVDELSRSVLRATPLEDVAARFDLESGRSLIERLYPQARMEVWTGTMTLPDRETFVRYWASFHHREVAESCGELIERAFESSGGFADDNGKVTVTRRSGAFIVDL
jgi:SAM-dependent methyltransferase